MMYAQTVLTLICRRCGTSTALDRYITEKSQKIGNENIIRTWIKVFLTSLI